MLDRARKYLAQNMTPMTQSVENGREPATPYSTINSGLPRTPPSSNVVRRLSENGIEAADGSDPSGKQRELYNKQQALLREQRTADQEKLLTCISGELLFRGGFDLFMSLFG